MTWRCRHATVGAAGRTAKTAVTKKPTKKPTKKLTKKVAKKAAFPTPPKEIEMDEEGEAEEEEDAEVEVITKKMSKKGL